MDAAKTTNTAQKMTHETTKTPPTTG